MPRDLGTITIRDGEILFQNFAGREATYNAPGKRNFCVVIDDEALAEQLARDGWNIKATKPREEGDVPRPYLQVKVMFGRKPPKIVMITSRGRTDLDEGLVDLLDKLDIVKADMIIRPFEWAPGKLSAYVKSLFVTVYEDELDLDYADVEYAQRPGDE
jgi:hypothetical protein